MKQLRTVGTLLSAWLLAVAPLAAQQADTAKVQGPPPAMSLAQAQEFAVNNSYTVRNAQISQKIAKKKIWETTAIGLPQVTGELGYQFIPNLAAFDLGIPNFPAMEMGEKHNLSYSITATQLLFSGEYLVGLKASKTYSQMADQSFEKSQRDVKEQVTSAYYNCLIVRESKSILDSVLSVLEKSYSDLQAMQAKGFVDNISADQLKMALLNQRNLADQLARAEQLTVMGLKSAANLPYQHQLQLTDNLETLIGQAKLDAQVQASVTNTSEYKLLETQEALTTLSMQRTKSKMLPTLAAFYRHKDYITENSFNMEPKDVVGVTLSVPIFSSGQRCSQIQQSKLELEQVQNTRAQARSGMELALSQARNELQSAQANLSAQKEQMELAKRIFSNTMKKHKMGMAGSNDISTAQKDLLSAQSAYFKAVSDALNAKLKLDKAAGNL